MKSLTQSEQSTSNDSQPKENSIESENENNNKPQHQSFASIITGGRSPENDALKNEILEATDETAEKANITADDSNDILIQKSIKRKRKIEFSTRKYDEKIIKETVNEEEEIPKKNKTTYSNFVKGGTEFEEKLLNVATCENRISSPVNDCETTNENICDMKTTLDAKLKFLSQGLQIADVMPVHVMQIQLQVSVE